MDPTRRHPNPDDLEPIERASIDELRALQLARLRAVLKRAFRNVAPYRVKCETVGVAPDDLKSLDDLARFPFTVKDDLRRSYPYGMFAAPLGQVVRVLPRTARSARRCQTASPASWSSRH